MSRALWAWGLCCAIVFSLALPACGATPTAYTWNNVIIGGGGFVTGMALHPTEDNLVYIRTDVGGAYRWDQTNEQWIPILNHLPRAQPNMYGVDAIAVDPSNPNVVYVACGKYDTWGGHDILKSTDRGETWTSTGFTPRNRANGSGRNYGERLAVDPNNSSIIYMGTRFEGLWKSTSGASHGSWQQVTSFPALGTTGHGLPWVVFDKNTGTPGNASQTIYVGVHGSGVYRSTNGGSTWSLLSGSPTNVTRAAIAPNGTLYVSHETGVAKFASGSWSNITPPSAGVYVGITVDPSNSNIVMAGRSANSSSNPMFRSTNGGSSWSQISYTKFPDVPWWVGNWFAYNSACLHIDPNFPNRVWFTDFFGTWRTDDITVSPSTWYTREYGHEEVVTFALRSPPSGSPLFSGHADVTGFRHTSLTAYPSTNIDGWGNTTGLDFQQTNPNFIVQAGDRWGEGRSAYSTNGGSSWTQFGSQPGSGGRIAVSANSETIVYVPQGLGPYYSTNRGASWTAGSGAPSNLVHTFWVWYHPLTSDRVTSNTFYLYDRNTGDIYRSTNGGASWSAVNTTTLPANSGGMWALKAAPGIAGELMIGLDWQGLYRSSNGGTSWTKLSNVQTARLVAYGKPPSGSTTPTMFVYGTVDNTEGIFRSDDLGSTWWKIDVPDPTIGNEANTMEGDMQTFGRVYIGTNGSGVYVGTPGGGTLPGTPSNLTATAGDGQVVLNWTAGSNATSYNVKRSTTSGGPYSVVANPTSTSHNDTTVTNGTTYYYVVSSVNAVGESANSNQASATPSSNTVAAPTFSPSAGTYTSAQSVTISSATSGASMRYTTDGSTPTSTTGTVYSEPVSIATTTTLKAIAYKSGMTDSSVTTGIYTINLPAAIAAGTATVDATVESAWNSATSYAMNNVTGTISSGSDLSGSFKGLWDSTNLYVLVDVTDDDKQNDSTDPWQDDSVELYLDGNNDKATTYDTNDRQYIFGWGDTAVVEAGGRSATGVTFAKADPTSTTYRIEAKVPWATLGVTASGGKNIGLDVHVNDDDAGGTREGKKQWNDTGDTAWQDPSVFGVATLQGGSAPATPTGLAATAGDAQVVLSWNASSGATSYNVKRSTTSGSGYSTIASPTTTGHTDGSLTNGTTYYYVVSAVNGVGESANSSQVSATPMGGPVAAPSFSPAAGTYTSAQSVTISSATSGASIRYTTDGSNPTSTTGTLYSGPVTISTTTTLKAIAYKSGMTDSSVTTGLYTINLPAAIAGGSATVDAAVESAWNSATAYSITHITGTIGSTSDSSGTWKGMWDLTNLYLLAEVTDDNKSNDSTNVWDDDSVELYLDGNNDKATSYDSNDRQYVFGWGDTAAVEAGGRSATGVTFAKADPTSTTYRIEAKVPWSTLGVTASSGKQIGLDVHINDDDAGGTREGKRQWHDTTDLAWQNPSLFGNGELQGGSSPATPTGLAATAGDAQVALSWNASTGATSYNVKRSTTSGSGYSTIASPTSTSHNDTTVTNGTTYYYVVSAVNGFGESSNSSQVSATPMGGPVAAPSFSPVAGTYTSAQSVTISTATSGASIRYTTDGSNPTSTTGTLYSGPVSISVTTTLKAIAYKTGMTDSTVTSGTYTISTGSSSDATIAAGTITVDGTVDAAWSSATSYSVSNVTVGSVANSGDLSATWKGMWDSSYLYVLAEVTDNDKRNDSTNPWEDDGVEVYIDGANNKATSYDANDAQYVLGWNDTSPAVGANTASSKLTGVTMAQSNPSNTTYKVEVRIPWTTTGVTAAAGNLIGFDVHVNDDDSGTTRDAKLAWFATVDNSWQNPGLFATANLAAASVQPPAAPTGLSATAGDGQVALSWNASSGATSYNVKRSTTSGGPYSTIASPTTTSYSNTGLTNGTTYYYVVSAVNSGGQSANSSQVSATPQASSPSLLVNYGFESGFVAPWENWGNAAETSDAAVGTKAVKVGTGEGGFGQTVDYTAGGTITLSVRVKKDSGTPYCNVGIDFVRSDGTEAGEVLREVTSTGSYGTITISNYAVPTGTARIRFWGWKTGTTGNLYVDEVLISTP